MYKLLLSWRYLRTRYIALASIISVTLGVATLIVVNSVMAGFRQEMHKRLHGILSDLVFESYGLSGFADPQWHMEEIRRIVGGDLAGMTPVVHVPAAVGIEVKGEYHIRQVNLIGVDKKTYAQVSQFAEFLQHPGNRRELSFLLREDGYAPHKKDFPPSGWRHRRMRASFEQALEEQRRQMEAAGGLSAGGASYVAAERIAATSQELRAMRNAGAVPGQRRLGKGPADAEPPEPASPQRTDVLVEASPTANEPPPADPFAGLAATEPYRPTGSEDEGRVFNEMTDQHPGIILGIAICSVRARNAGGDVRDYYLCRPGDDVIVTLPNANPEKPQAISSRFTVVDLYESKMSEYDSSFAFVPIDVLQELRGMVDPQTGVKYVTSIQIKLKRGANLNAVRDRLRAEFPPDQYPYRIQTWRDLQGPLLAAVSLETTILNILLFLIIAVAGFGILATFFMIVVEKTRDIGILKALGAPSGGVMSIFLAYGVSLGAVGSGVGMVLGLLFVVYINPIRQGLEKLTGQEVFDPTVYYFDTIPTNIEPTTVAAVVAGAVMIAVLASVLPAIRAARLHPVDALRYE